MNKALLLLIPILGFFSGAANGQPDPPGTYHWNLGVSTGDILHELFGDDDEPKSYAAFVVEYAGKKYAVQGGLRPAYNLSHTHHEGFMDSDVTETLAFSGHVAVTRTVWTDPKWLIRAGLKYDGGWSREDITKDSGFDRVITRRLQWNGGLGPVIDFRFFVHPRISLGTDASVVYSYSKSELQQLFTNFPDFNNTKDTVTSDKVVVQEPATVYLRFHF